MPPSSPPPPRPESVRTTIAAAMREDTRGERKNGDTPLMQQDDDTDGEGNEDDEGRDDNEEGVPLLVIGGEKTTAATPGAVNTPKSSNSGWFRLGMARRTSMAVTFVPLVIVAVGIRPTFRGFSRQEDSMREELVDDNSPAFFDDAMESLEEGMGKDFVAGDLPAVTDVVPSPEDEEEEEETENQRKPKRRKWKERQRDIKAARHRNKRPLKNSKQRQALPSQDRGNQGERARLDAKLGKNAPEDLPFRVQDQDNRVPMDADYIAKSTAAEALECWNAVTDFVINATDIRDECEGLRNGFGKTCTNAEAGSSSSSSSSQGDTEDEVEDVVRQRRLQQQQRRNRCGLQRFHHLWTPIRTWQVYLFWTVYEGYDWVRRSLWRYLDPPRGFWWNRETESTLLFMENEVIGPSWDDAGAQLRQEEFHASCSLGLDDHNNEGRCEATHQFFWSKLFEGDSADAFGRQLKRNRAAGEKREEDKHKVEEGNEEPEEKDTAQKEVKKAPTHLGLPTHEGHLTDQTLGDALMLMKDGVSELGGENETLSSVARMEEENLNRTKEEGEEDDDDDDDDDDSLVDETDVADDDDDDDDDKSPPELEPDPDAPDDIAQDPAVPPPPAQPQQPSAAMVKQCCASIVNVYHEHCDNPESDEFSDQRLFIVVSVIALCGMVKSLIRHFKIRWLPEAAGCIVVGVFCGMVLPDYDFFGFDGDMFLRVMVPPIVFEAALSIDKNSFRRHAFPIFIYSVIGTMFSTFVTALVVHRGTQFLSPWCINIPFVESLTFGALISSIDPIAVLSVLNNMGMTDTDTIYVLIFGESLLNDGVAIVLFETLRHFLDEQLEIDGEAVRAAAEHFVVVAVGSVAVGAFAGACCTAYYWLMRGCHTPLVEVLMFICWAYIPYYICDGMEWSGIVAVVAAGFVMDMYVVGERSHGHGQGGDHTISGHFDDDDFMIMNGSHTGQHDSWERTTAPRGMMFSKKGHLSAKAKAHIHFVTEINATMMETAIFAYLGLFLFSSRYHWNFWLTVISILSCLVSRGVMIPSLSWLSNSWSRASPSVRRLSRRLVMGNAAAAAAAASNDEDSGSGAFHTSTSSNNNKGGVIIDRRMQIVLWFAGLRGAMSFALVENIPIFDTGTKRGTRFKRELKSMTSASIVFTVFILGGLTYYVIEHLGMSLTPKCKAKRTASQDAGDAVEMRPLVGSNGSKATSNSSNNSSSTNSTTASEAGKVRQRIVS